MRSQLTRLSASALILTFALSSGAACALNILPGAFNNPNWPNTAGRPFDRASAIDEPVTQPLGSFRQDYSRATRLMGLAIKAKNRGDLTEACQLANRALLIVSRSSSLGGSAMESDYSAFASEVCQAAEKA